MGRAKDGLMWTFTELTSIQTKLTFGNTELINLMLPPHTGKPIAIARWATRERGHWEAKSLRFSGGTRYTSLLCMRENENLAASFFFYKGTGLALKHCAIRKLHMTDLLLLSIWGEASSSVALLKVSSLFYIGYFLFLGSFSWSDVRSWDSCRMCTDCKANL